MEPMIVKASQVNEFFFVLTHVKENLWLVEKYDVVGPDLVYRKQHGSRDVSGEADARHDYDSQIAVFYATAAILNRPLTVTELKPK